ncbi:MAG: hypothetical protein AB1403_16460 [Candidatus Riflebacteria bacterium]
MSEIISQLDLLIAKANTIADQEYLALLNEVKEKEQEGCSFWQVSDLLDSANMGWSVVIHEDAPLPLISQRVIDISLYSDKNANNFQLATPIFSSYENLAAAA